MTNPYLPPSGPMPPEQPAFPAPGSTPYAGNTPPYGGYIPPATRPAPSPPMQPSPPHGYGGYAPYTPPQKRGIPRWAVGLISGCAAGMLGLVLGLAAASPDDSSDNAGDSEATTGSGDSGTWNGTDDAGSPDNPYPFNALPFQGDDWNVVLSKAPHNATDEIKSTISGHASPASGMEYWIIPVKAEYVGGGRAKATAAQQISMFFRDGEGRRYMSSCGAIPDDLADTGHPTDGETVSGNLCLQVPKGANGLWGLFQEDSWVDYLSTKVTDDPADEDIPQQI